MKKIGLSFLSALLTLCFSSAIHSQTMYTVAGTGAAAYSGDGAAATLAQVNDPRGVATDAAGNIYISDFANHRIRKISTTGVITTIAGTGFGGYSGDGGAATAAWIKWPIGIAIDAAGNVYFSDFGNNIIRKINTSGNISTIAGTPGSIPGYSGDGGPATAAVFGNPWGIAIDAAGNVLIADALNHRIRKVTVSTGIISSIAGNGFVGFLGDGGPATAATCRLNEPTGVAVDGAGNIYIADNANNRVRKINTSGIISTIAGLGVPFAYTGDGGPATAARFSYPKGIAADVAGNVYICDWNNSVVRKINTSGIINTLGGTGVAGYSGDGIPALSAQLNQPTGIAVRYDGDVFITDNANNRVRRIKIGNDPYFTLGESRSVTICPSESSYIDTVMRVDDIDVGQTLTWSPVLLPSHATLVATYTTTSTGSTVTPVGIIFSPHTGYTGLDTFSVRVNDGTYSDTITIFANIVGAPFAGGITGPDSVCPGHSITLNDTVGGGTWSSSDGTKATVTSGGIVSGVLPGSVIITYTFTNFCGSAIALHTVNVLATVPCISSVPGMAQSGETAIVLTPNPNNGKFALSINAGKISTVHIDIFNVVGCKVYEQNIKPNTPGEIQLNQPAGIYFAHIYIDNVRYLKKIHVEN